MIDVTSSHPSSTQPAHCSVSFFTLLLGSDSSAYVGGCRAAGSFTQYVIGAKSELGSLCQSTTVAEETRVLMGTIRKRLYTWFLIVQIELNFRVFSVFCSRPRAAALRFVTQASNTDCIVSSSGLWNPQGLSPCMFSCLFLPSVIRYPRSRRMIRA